MAKKKKKATYIKLEPEAAYELADDLADILNNTIHNYWLSSSDAETATADCYKVLRIALNKATAISFRIFDGALMINGDAIRDKSHNIEVLVDHLETVEIDNFTMTSDIDEAGFANMLEILEANKDELDQLGGFATCLEQFKIKGVETRNVVFQEVGEDEMLIDKDDLKQDSGGNGPSQETVGSILAFLKGEVPTDDTNAVKQIQETATDAGQMADLILNAAEIRRQETPIEDGESMVDLVVGCLRRTYESITQQKSARTKTGKKRITKNLLLLEKEVLDRMREMSMDWTDDDLQAIVDATQEMTDELKIDSLADEYISTKKINKNMEKHILDYIESVGIDNVDILKQKLSAKGMDMSDWKELVVKSGSGAGIGAGAGPGDGGEPGAGEGMGPGEGGDGIGIGGGLGMGSGFALGSLVDAIGHLDVALGNMEAGFSNSDGKTQEKDSNELVNALENATGQVRSIAKGTGQKIDFLINNLQADEDTINHAEESAIAAGVELKMTRKAMLQILADIVREIYEPLTVIKISMDIIKSNTMSGLTENQTKSLRIADESTDMIVQLLKKLENISLT